MSGDQTRPRVNRPQPSTGRGGVRLGLILTAILVLVGWRYQASRDPAGPIAPPPGPAEAPQGESPVSPAVVPEPAGGVEPLEAPAPRASEMPVPLVEAACPLFEQGPVSLPSRDPVSSDWQVGAEGYERGEQEQRLAKAPLVVYFFTDWCGYCKKLDAGLLAEPEVDEFLRSQVVKVRVNPETGTSEGELAARYGVHGYPSVFLVTPGFAPKRLSVFRSGRPDAELRSPDDFVQSIKDEVSRRAKNRLHEGYQRRKAGDPTGSITALDQAIDLDPENPEAYLQRAISYEESGQAGEAVEDYRRAVDLKPDYLEVYQRLDASLARQARWSESVACWTKLIERDPSNAAA